MYKGSNNWLQVQLAPNMPTSCGFMRKKQL